MGCGDWNVAKKDSEIRFGGTHLQPQLGRLRKGHGRFKACLGDIARLSLKN